MNLELSRINAYPYILAIWSDHADFVQKPLTGADLEKLLDLNKLLEVRAFGPTGEYRAYRNDLTQTNYVVRAIDGEEPQAPENAYDENQYLDIDTARTQANADGWIIYTIGGGRYHLPYKGLPDIHKQKLLLITRTYFEFDDNGIAHKTDWRLVGFAKEEHYGTGTK